jgi:hypothetical protein
MRMARRTLVAVVAGVAIASAALPAAADAPRGALRLIRLSERGPAFLAYDGTPDFARAGRDWPVSIVFAGHASVGKVKQALRGIGFTRRGHLVYLGYRIGAQGPRFDGDRGLKTPCDSAGTDVHLRIYAPTATDRFPDPEFGDVVVATTHFDRADACGTPPTLFGFSEVAEDRVASLVAARLHWRVQRDELDLANAEPYRRDVADSAHVWWSDGRATLITVP